MGRTITRLLHTAAVILSTAAIVNAGLWDVDIDLDPAPSPEEGPPFSAHALRNRDFLPYEIIGLVGAYFGFVLILGTLLLTVGRRLRKQAQQVAARPIEMVKPVLSAVSSRSKTAPWLRKDKNSMADPDGSRAMSPSAQSLSSIDLSVVERDRQKQVDVMAQIYGVVYKDEEDQKTLQASTTTLEFEPDHRNHSRPDLRPLDIRRLQSSGNYPASPVSPRSPVHAIYPPRQGMIDARSPASLRYQPQQISEREERIYHPSDDVPGPRPPPLSKRHHRPFSKLTISSPLSSRFGDDNSDGARTPLSPRFYTNPGTPPEPPSALTIANHYRNPSNGTTTTTSQRTQHNYTPSNDLSTIPQANLQRPPNKNRAALPHLTTTTTTNNPLPFRTYQTPTSPPHTKTTILSTSGRTNNFPSLLTGNATPYSAYFPGKLVQPVTPHITTKFERLQKEKEEKALRGAMMAEDQVVEESEIWEDAY